MLRTMIQLSLKILIFLAGIFVSGSFSTASDVNCDQLKSVQDVVSCALKAHPDARLAQASLEQGQYLEDSAGQRPNPELNSQAVLGNTAIGDRFTYLEFNLAANFELGGKRSSRIEKANAEFDQRRAGAVGAREQVFISTLLSLYRTRQIQSELEVLKGALESFARIQKQYRARPRLNPEQTASLLIFEIAEGDYKLRLAPLETELDRQVRGLELALGKPFTQRPELLPERKKTWPRISDSLLSEPISGSQVQGALADRKFAQAQLELAQSGSWPDLKIGPTFERQNQGFSSFNAVGLNFSLPLPLFHFNGAERAYAHLGLGKAELSLEATRKEAQDQREYFFKRYGGAVKALENSITPRELDKKHLEVELLFDRGLLPGTLVVEIHRQMVDFTKIQNEQELAAIESLARFNALRGRLFEEQL